MEAQLLTETEAAELLNVSARTLQAWRYQKRGPQYVRLGGCARYRPEDLAEFIECGIVETRDLRAER